MRGARSLLHRATSNTHEVARSGVLTGASAATGAIASFLLLIVVTRGTTIDTAGLFFQCLALTTAGALISTFGAATSLTRAMARFRRHGGADATDDVWAALLPVGITGVVLGVAGSLSAPGLADLLTNPEHQSELTGLVRVMMLAVPFMAVTQLLSALCRGVDDPLAGALFDLGGQPALRVIAALAAVTAGASAAELGLVIVVPALFSFVGLALRSRRTLTQAGITWSLRPTWNVRTAAPFWRFSGPRGLEEIVQASSIWLLTLLVGAIGGPAQAATYAAITRFTMATTLVLQSVTTAMLPRLAVAFFKHHLVEANRLFQVTTRWIIIGSIPACLSLLLFPTTLSVRRQQRTSQRQRRSSGARDRLTGQLRDRSGRRGRLDGGTQRDQSRSRVPGAHRDACATGPPCPRTRRVRGSGRLGVRPGDTERDFVRLRAIRFENVSVVGRYRRTTCRGVRPWSPCRWHSLLSPSATHGWGSCQAAWSVRSLGC